MSTKPKTGRGVLYIVWPSGNDEGDRRLRSMLERSIASLTQWHPELPYHVAELPAGSTLLDKSRMYDLSPFLTTLYLDADTVVLDRLDFGFERAVDFGMALTICECPYARRFTSIGELSDTVDSVDPGGQKLELDGEKWKITERPETVETRRVGRLDMLEYNTGVIFFSHFSKGTFDHWQLTAGRLDSRLPFIGDDGEPRVMPINDQASFAHMMYHERWNPFVLPLNWNLRPIWQKSFFGPIKIWHDYSAVPASLVAWNKTQQPGNVIEYTSLTHAPREAGRPHMACVGPC